MFEKMKVLIVCSHRHYSTSGIAPFVEEQAETLRQSGVEVAYFVIRKKGILGYLRERKAFLQKLLDFNPDIVHAHVGMSGLLANLQRKVPVVTTYHGSDINRWKGFVYSWAAMRLSKWNIFVSRRLFDKAGAPAKSCVIPCAVDTDLFVPMERTACRAYFNMVKDDYYILFSKAFSVPVKNYPLAKAAILLLQQKVQRPVHLVELKGYTRQEVAMLMNACDCGLMTSFSEGSPQFVKESLACNCPIVSTDVGDVSDVIAGIEGCSLTTYEPEDVCEKLYACISTERKNMNTHEYIVDSFGEKRVAVQIMNLYKNILN